jgi:hypothetical protein
MTPWREDRPINKASICTVEHNTEKRVRINMSEAGLEYMIPVLKLYKYASHLAKMSYFMKHEY